jgi:hypothetical protein
MLQRALMERTRAMRALRKELREERNEFLL